jgi:hypothetical protein
MRYAIACALILISFGEASVPASAMPASGNAVVKAGSSKDVIKVGGGCGAKFWPNKKTGKCEG